MTAARVPTSSTVVFGWYDNEWGYANRLVDVVERVGRKAAPTRSRTSPKRVRLV